jgi:hypothetical protein
MIIAMTMIWHRDNGMRLMAYIMGAIGVLLAQKEQREWK